uniref:Fibronectin type-III domain-containing protein n=1 Tax=Globodera pallida TaxID=36090 RepID=A0A183CDG0_GLOPA
MLTTSSSAIPPPPSASSFSSTLPIGRRSPPSCTSSPSSPEVVAVPVWQNDGGTTMKQQQQQQQQPTTTMEPIPEDEEESVLSASTSFIGQPEASPTAHPSTSAQSPSSALPPCQDGQHRFSSPTSAGMDTEVVAKRITESKRRLRETYTTEEIDTLVSTLPKDSVPVEWEHFSTKEVVVDPKMAHTYVTELAGGIPSARGTKYSYTYESRVEEEGQNEMEESQSERRRRRSSEEAAEEHPPVTQLRSEEEERELGREVRRGEDGTERHCTSTQKITRVTKITTTRQVKQIPVDPGDVYFDADGNPILNGFDAQNISAGSNPDEEEFSGGLDSSVGIDLSRTYISESEQYFSSPQTSSTTQQGSQSVSPPVAGDDRYFTATPGAPGLPEVTELTDSTISLAWLRPDFDGTAGPLIGYRVEFRRSDFDDWDPAHDDLLGETECKRLPVKKEDDIKIGIISYTWGGEDDY